ncbi:MAG: PhoPQ-activated protein PqaA family protein [Planctomycetota bacterium]
MKTKSYSALSLLGLLCISGLGFSTPLDDYIALPDPNFTWTEVDSVYDGDFWTNTTATNLKVTSQLWRTPNEVDTTEWTHWVTVIEPGGFAITLAGGVHDTALILINGGDIGESAPIIDPADPNHAQFRNLALGTRSVIVELRGVPNQPLVFADDPNARSEDEIIAYSWDKFLNGGDDEWLVQLPMVKSVVACMDAVQQFDDTVSGMTINDFVLTGGSKRGWTAWLTAAVDNRVTAIAPIVSDLLNMPRSFAHHWSCYGFWADALAPYEEMNIFDWFDTPRADELVAIVDPYAYRDRLTIPKLIITAAGDDFFVHDSIQFYFDDLLGETYVRTVPNTNHYLDGAFDTVFENMVPYYDAFLRGQARPDFSWVLEDDGSMTVIATDTPLAVNLWQADNPTVRDFRQVTIGTAWTSTPLTEDPPGSGVYIAAPGVPATGWRSYFVELVYDFSGAIADEINAFDYHFTTEMRVLPEMRPYETDWTRDGLTDLADVSVLSVYWLSETPYYDIMPRRTGDGVINLGEMSIFSLHWLGVN